MAKTSPLTKQLLELHEEMQSFKQIDPKEKAIPALQEKLTTSELRRRYMGWPEGERRAWREKQATPDDPLGVNAVMDLLGPAPEGLTMPAGAEKAPMGFQMPSA